MNKKELTKVKVKLKNKVESHGDLEDLNQQYWARSEYTVRKMDLLLRCIQRRLQMQLSMARKFTLQPYRR
jgi:hypothetical protein